MSDIDKQLQRDERQYQADIADIIREETEEEPAASVELQLWEMGRKTVLGILTLPRRHALLLTTRGNDYIYSGGPVRIGRCRETGKLHRGGMRYASPEAFAKAWGVTFAPALLDQTIPF